MFSKLTWENDSETELYGKKLKKKKSMQELSRILFDVFYNSW